MEVNKSKSNKLNSSVDVTMITKQTSNISTLNNYYDEIYPNNLNLSYSILTNKNKNKKKISEIPKLKRSQSHKKQDYKNKNIGTIVYEELNEDDSENLYYNNNNIISPINSYQKNFKNKMIYYENLSPEIRNLAINLLASNPINWNEIEPIDNFNLNDFEEDNLESFNLNNCNYENKVINDNTFFKGNKNKIIYKNYYCNLNNNCSNNKKEINNVPTILGRILKQEANKKNKV
jgi:hypothetical protein